MSGIALARPRRVTGIAVALSAVAGLLAALAVMAALGGSGAATSGKEFRFAVPSGWRSASAKELAAMPSHPAAALRRADGKGVVLVRRIAPLRASGTQLVRELGTRLRGRFPGFHAVGARFTRLRGGRAFVYTFTRDPHATAQTIAFATAGERTYEIDAVVPARATDAARDAAAIIASFGP